MAHNVITKDEADEIDGINVHSDKMDKVITIVETSLALELTTKYRGFLKSMKESEDDTLKEYAKKLPIGESISYRAEETTPPIKLSWLMIGNFKEVHRPPSCEQLLQYALVYIAV